MANWPIFACNALTSGPAAWRSAGGRKEFQGPLQELTLPLGDLVRVDVELLREFGQGLVSLQGRQGYLGLERGGVIPSGAFHPLLSFPGRLFVLNRTRFPWTPSSLTMASNKEGGHGGETGPYP